MSDRLRGALRWMLPFLLTACGGAGGGGGGTGSVTTTPAALTPVSVSLSTDSQTTTVTPDGSSAPIGFDAIVTGTPSTAVVADVQFDRSQVSLAGPITQLASGGYRVRLTALPTLGNGTYSGVITFRLCQDTGCSSIYPGSAATFTYRMTVQPAGWSMFQRNAAHDGYVPATFDPTNFRKAWEYAPADITRLTTIASAGDQSFVTVLGADGVMSVRALSTATGAQRWLYAIGKTTYASAPSVGSGKVYVTSMVTSSSDNTVTPINATTGEFAGPTAPFASQWSQFLPPTPFAQGVYISAGYYGSVVYGYDYTALKYWDAAVTGSVWDGETPAVDADNVYYYAGDAMIVLDRETGSLKKTMPDPFFQRTAYTYHGAPILGSRKNVLAYSGHRYALTSSVLVNWSIETGTVAWRSADTYVTTPALGNGVVYLARNTPARFDALSEATGAVLWSWSPPAGERFVKNTVASANLVFVSTDKAVYALPVNGANHAPVWSAATGGELAITGDGTLIVSVDVTDRYGFAQPKMLVAYRLQ